MKENFLIVLIALGVRSVMADTIVQWGASGGEDIVSDSCQMEYSDIRTLQTSTPANPAFGENDYYSGHSSDRSWKFYQAISGASESGSYYPNEIHNDSSYDYLQIRDILGTTYPINSVLFWKKEDFLNGMNNAEVSLTSFYMEADSHINATSLRWVVQDAAENFYISDYTMVGNSGYASYELTDLSSVSWYTYDPGTDISVDGIGAEVAGITFDDVAGVGFRVYVNASDSSNEVIRIRDFEVTAVPEPGTLGMLGLIGAICFFIRRRFVD